MEDIRIIELFFARDEAALLETERKYGGRLTALACSITEDPQDAEECVNDTYLEVWQAIPPARPDHFFAFLAKILRHNALTVCEKRHAKKREGGHGRADAGACGVPARQLRSRRGGGQRGHPQGIG